LVKNGRINLFPTEASGKQFWRYRGKQFAEEIL
jgi:hypothetical protein